MLQQFLALDLGHYIVASMSINDTDFDIADGRLWTQAILALKRSSFSANDRCIIGTIEVISF